MHLEAVICTLPGVCPPHTWPKGGEILQGKRGFGNGSPWLSGMKAVEFGFPDGPRAGI